MEYAGLIIGLLGVAFGINAYVHLWRWAKTCQRASIAIAHKGRVQLNAPLTEWLSWVAMLNNDEAVKGRTVYRNGHVSVSILTPKSQITAKTTIKKLRRFSLARKRKPVT